MICLLATIGAEPPCPSHRSCPPRTLNIWPLNRMLPQSPTKARIPGVYCDWNYRLALGHVVDLDQCLAYMKKLQ